MKIAVCGLWHLGWVTAACLAHLGHEVIGYDSNEAFTNPQSLPIDEPDLETLVQEGVANKRLRLTNNIQAIKNVDVIWVTYDTPVDDNDKADVNLVKEKILTLLPHLNPNGMVLISSQLPAGSIQEIVHRFKTQYPQASLHFAYSPENLRLGKAINAFLTPDRIVVGIDSKAAKSKLEPLMVSICKNIQWMSIASAEVTKHAINAFLATSIVFINELARICEATGADAYEVEVGLKSESRIGPKAYLHPGSAFAGGTLARDIRYLIDLAEKRQIPPFLLEAVLKSNNFHKTWIYHKLKIILNSYKNKKIIIVGLTYKDQTNTLRRSSAIELNHQLKHDGAQVLCYDPQVQHLPLEYQKSINLQQDFYQMIRDADALIFHCYKKSFASMLPDKIFQAMRHPIIIDPDGKTNHLFAKDQRFQYFSVGRNV